MNVTSAHFSESELICKHCGTNGMQRSTLDLAEDVRSKAEDHYGQGRVKLVVLSAYRCSEHNKEIGGAPHSQHLMGLALDVGLQIAQDYGGKGKRKWVPVSPAVFEQIARRSKLLGGIGRDDARGFVHIDARPRTTAACAQWCYSGSKEVPYYPAVQSTSEKTT